MITTMTARPHSVLRRSLEIAVTVCLLAACSDASPRPAGPSWLEYRGDLARDGHPSAATLTTGDARTLGLAWSAHLDGAVDGTPAVVRGMVIAGTAAGTLYALDSSSGKTIWSKRGFGGMSSSPTIAGDSVYVTTTTGHALAFGLERGNLRWDWSGDKDWAIWASPVVYRDEVIIGVASPYGDQPLVAGRLYALDLAHGLVRWDMCLRAGCAPGDGVWSTAAIDASGTAYVGVGNPDDAVLAFDAVTGKPKWWSPLYPDAGRDVDVGASPVVYMLDGREAIWQATVEGRFVILDASDGAIRASRPLVAGSAVHGLLASPAYDGTRFYVASASPPTGLFAIDGESGGTLWRHDTGLPGYSAPAVGNGVVVFGTGNVFGDLTTGSLVALSAADGQVVWTYDTNSAVRSGPALVGKMVVVGDYAGDLMAFSPKH